MLKLPRVLVGKIMMYCPEKVIDCIKFLRIWPRALEIILRPRYVQRRDMEALQLRGTIEDLMNCARTKWAAGFFWLAEKYNYSISKQQVRAIELGINFYAYSDSLMNDVYCFTTPPYKTNHYFLDILNNIRLPAAPVRHWIAANPDEWRVCIFQNQWDLAAQNVKAGSTIHMTDFINFSKHKARKYLNFCKTHDLINKDKILYLFNCWPMRRRIFRIIMEIFPDCGLEHTPIRTFHSFQLRMEFKNYKNIDNLIVEHPRTVCDSQLNKVQISDKARRALVAAGRFKYLY